MSEWQDIATAPKNKGEHDILVFCADTQEMFVAFWHAGIGWQYAVRPEGEVVCVPTHWRQLPEPPELPMSVPFA